MCIRDRLTVGDGDIGIYNVTFLGDHFMNGADPSISHFPTEKPFPVIGKSGISIFVKGYVVLHHHHIGFWGERAFQLQKFFSVLIQKYIVCIQPENIILCGLGEGVVAGCGKIVFPGEGVDCGVLSSDMSSGIAGAGIHYYDFIRYSPDAFYAAGQNVFLIFYDHTKADLYHRRNLPLCKRLGLRREAGPLL